MVTAVVDPAGETGSLVIRPHAPLSAAGTLLVFVLVDAPIIAVAVVCGLLGSWYVLPYSLAVVVAVGIGLWAGYRRTQVREVVSIEGEAVAVDRGHRRREEHFEFRRGWVQVILEEIGSGRDRLENHLFIRSHGRQVELGAFLDEPERRDLAARLRQLMGPTRSFGAGAGTS